MVLTTSEINLNQFDGVRIGNPSRGPRWGFLRKAEPARFAQRIKPPNVGLAETQEKSRFEGRGPILRPIAVRLTTEGIIIATFTPLRGLTPFLKQYLETAVMPGTEAEAKVDAKSHFYPAGFVSSLSL